MKTNYLINVIHSRGIKTYSVMARDKKEARRQIKTCGKIVSIKRMDYIREDN